VLAGREDKGDRGRVIGEWIRWGKGTGCSDLGLGCSNGPFCPMLGPLIFGLFFLFFFDVYVLRTY
jgi:hypothetical protein